MMDSVDGARASDKPTDAYSKFQSDPCAFSGLVKEASTFCTQCQEYMCITCASAHSGLTLTRNHTMVSGSDLALTGQSVAASRSPRPVSTGPSGIDQPVAISRSACPESGRKSWLDVKVVSSTTINVSSTKVAGSAVMPDGRVILADWQNKQIILLDKDFTVQSTLALPDEPYSVAVYGDNAAVVTMLGMELQYIHVNTTLRAGHTIQIGELCWGVAVHGGEMYVCVSSGQYGCHVQVMDTRGNVTRRIGVDVHGTGRCNILPYYIAVGTEGTVYMSNYISDHIACYTSTGDVVYDVKHEGLSAPYGILVDKEDNLLVCCYVSNTMHVLGKDGAHRRVILSSDDGLVCPQSVSYRRSDQTLIVTMDNTPSVRAYKLN